MENITIKQLDANGNVYRTFTRHVYKSEVEQTLDGIAQAFNQERTKVYLNGELLPEESAK